MIPTFNLFPPHKPQFWFLKTTVFVFLIQLSSADTETIDFSEYFPIAKDNYWSWIGEVETDEFNSRINIRREIDGVTPVDDKRTFRSTQEVIAGLSENLDQVGTLNKKDYFTTKNGWLVFREEYQGNILQYDRPAKILPLHPEVEKSNKYKTRFDSESGSSGVVSYHTVVIGKEEIGIPNGVFEALKINQEKKTKITSGDDEESIASMTTEYNSFWLVKGVGIVKQESTITTITDSGSESIDLNYHLVSTDALPNYLWPEAAATPEGWKQVSWFGNLTDNYFPWIFHADHGWLFVEAKDTSEVKLWSENLGWWLTSKELYPTFYSLDLNDWLTYQQNEAVEREFVRSDGSVLRASNAGFTYRPDTSRPQATAITETQTNRIGDASFQDSFGNRYVDSDSGFVADQGESPFIELISPLEGRKLEKDEKLVILADAYDKDGKIEFVSFYVNGRPVAFDETVPFQIIYTPTSDEDSLTVYAVAKDNLGNNTQSNSVEVAVDVSKFPPKVRIDSPLNKTVYKSEKRVHVEVVASDHDGFIESVALLVDGIQVGSELTSPPYRFSFIPPIDGSYQISALAIDDDSNESEANPISITVNETGRAPSSTSFPPEVRIVKPLNKSQFNVGDTIEIEAYATDEDGFVDRVQIFVDGVQVGSTFTSAPYRVFYKPQTTGNSSITAIARDDERNSTTSTAIQVNIN